MARQMKELEKENARLNKLVADQALDMLILKEAARPNFWTPSDAGGPSRRCAVAWGMTRSVSVVRAKRWGSHAVRRGIHPGKPGD